MLIYIFCRVYPVFRRKQILYDLTNTINTVATHSNNENNYDSGTNFNDKYFKYLVNGTALSILIAYGIYGNSCIPWIALSLFRTFIGVYN